MTVTDHQAAGGTARTTPRVDTVAWAGAAVAAGFVVVASVPSWSQAVLTRVPWLIVPGAVGAPPLLPAFRPWAPGDLTWATALSEALAAALLVGWTHRSLAARRMRHPDAGFGRVLLMGWAAFVTASALVGVVRAAYLAGVTPVGWKGTVAYLVGGLLVGALWGATLGWAVGLVAALVRLAAGEVGADARPRSLGRGLLTLLATGAVGALLWLLGAASSGPLLARGPSTVTLPVIAAPTDASRLQGLNTAGDAKNSPDGMPWVTQADIAREQVRLGSNVVRFLVFWSRVEPEPGRYDQAYLDRVAQRVGWYRQTGMQVVLDVHQDVWGPTVGFDGAPGWATVTDGLPSAKQSTWELTYLQPGVLRAFDHFWGNVPGRPDLQQRYLAMLGELAGRFGSDPTVLGLDVMNEPYGGTLQGPQFEQGPLSAFYQRAVDTVRPKAPDWWVLVEPQAFGVNQGLPSGLRPLRDPRPGAPRIAYAPHLYPLPLDLGSSYASRRGLVDRSIGAWTTSTRATARRLDAPALLGEFGLDGTQPGAPQYVTTVVRAADDAGLSGYTLWDSTPGAWSPWRKDDPSRLTELGRALAEANGAPTG